MAKKKIPAKPAPETKVSTPKNSEFEAKLDQVAADSAAAGSLAESPPAAIKENRGGPRPGAGRPRGSTDEFVAVNKLPEKANMTLVPVLQIPFELWSVSQNLKELALSKDEAEQFALPVTQLLEYYFPGKIPEIAFVWLMLLGTSYNILKPRLELISKIHIHSVPGRAGPANSSSAPVPPSASPPKNGYPKAE